jgi:hypothetical protein
MLIVCVCVFCLNMGIRVYGQLTHTLFFRDDDTKSEKDDYTLSSRLKISILFTPPKVLSKKPKLVLGN